MQNKTQQYKMRDVAFFALSINAGQSYSYEKCNTVYIISIKIEIFQSVH